MGNIESARDLGQGVYTQSEVDIDKIPNGANSAITDDGTNVTISGAMQLLSEGGWAGLTGGLVLETPIYKEYQFKWGGLSSHTITLICGSYQMSEVVYTAHQTNGGGDYNEYRRGRWSNNHTTHVWSEFENSGDLGAMTTTFTVSENDVSNSGKLVIQETYGSGSYSYSTLTVRCYYGTIAAAIS